MGDRKYNTGNFNFDDKLQQLEKIVNKFLEAEKT